MKLIWLLIVGVFLFAQIDLTPKEKKFLSSHKFICVTTPNWAPFNMLNNKKIDGIAIDYLNLIAKKLNIKIKCNVVKSWDEAIEQIKQKKADIIPATSLTLNKKKYALFSIPYARYPIVIATQNNIGFIDSLIYLKNKTFAVGKNYSVAEIIKKHYPYIKLIEVDNIKTALKMVSESKVFGAIDNLPVIAYHITKYQFANLKISGRLKEDFNVSFMIRDDYPLLLSAINKAIKSITKEEKEKIFNKWLYVVYQEGIEFNKLITIGTIVLGIFLILIAVILYQYFEIKKRRRFENELIKNATIDSLTEIFNRKHIDYMLQKETEEAKRYATPLSVIFCDIDHFKHVNDKFGHKVGDSVLEELAKIMKKNIRKSDILGRWGGEEFLIILPHTSLKDAINVAKKLQNAIRKHNFSHVGHITCSFGVTEFRMDDSIYRLMIRVDQALYEAKRSGRDKIIIKE